MSRLHLFEYDPPQSPVVATVVAEITCGICGRVHDRSARYCSNCGQWLAARPFSEEDTIAHGRPPLSSPGEALTAPAGNAAAATPPRPLSAGVRQRTAQIGRRWSARGARDRFNVPDPSACALLSFFFPGVGQMCARQWAKGALLVTLAFVAVRWFHLSDFGLLMLIGRLLCARDAYRIAQRVRAGRHVDEWDWALSSDKR